MQRDTLFTTLPEPARRPARRADWGRRVARVACVLFAIFGILPFAIFFIVRTPLVRAWATTESERLLREQGIGATYGIEIRLWPLSLELTDVKVAASDGGGPLLTSRAVRVRPRVFPLLSGKLAIDQIEIDAPHVRAVLTDGKLANLDLKLPESKEKKPFRAPFNVFAVTDAEIDLDIDGARLLAHEIDLDVTAEDEAARSASTLEIAIRAGSATFHRSRLFGDPAHPQLAVDEDILCGLDGRVRYEGNEITIRRLTAQGSADLEIGDGTTPPCSLLPTDKRRVDIALNHLNVFLPEKDGDLPKVDGHVKVRFPVGLLERAIAMPQTDGWIGIDLDVRYAEDTLIPDVSGHIEAHDIRLDQFNFAREVQSDVLVRRNVVTSARTTVSIGDGVAVFTDTVVEPLTKGGLLKKTRLDISNVNFTTLLRDLGIHKTPHVAWDIREIHVPMISGTFSPLHLDGDFTAHTQNFGIYDRPATDPARGRIIGVTPADITAHLAVRPDGVKFQNTHVRAGSGSEISGGNVSLGFKDDLRVDIERAAIDIDDISPVGSVKMSGKLVAKLTVTGKFGHGGVPLPEGEVSSISGFKIGDVQFGDISAGKFKIDVVHQIVDIAGLHGKKGTSEYDVPTAKLDFKKHPGLDVDALAFTNGLELTDFLSMFNLDKDPRMQGISARISTKAATVHVAMGGPEDVCGGGFIEVRAKTHATNVELFGEKFESGDADFELAWHDRQVGLAGADLDIRSFVLNKALAGNESIGTVLGAASIRRGGALSAHIVVDNMPLSRLDSFGAFRKEIDGRVNGVAQVHGTLDEFDPKNGFTVNSEIDVSPVRVRTVVLGPSHVHLVMTQTGTPSPRAAAIHTTACGSSVPPPFDREKYLRDESAHGAFVIDGELFGKTVVLRELTLTREKNPHLKGGVELRDLDIGAMARVAMPAKKYDTGVAAPELHGQASGFVDIRDVPFHDLARSHVELRLDSAVVSRGAQTVSVDPPKDRIVVHADNLTLPTEGLRILLKTKGGFGGSLKVVGGVANLTRGDGASLGFIATMQTLNLAEIAPLLPKVERASGTVNGEVTVTGTVASPEVAGTAHVRADEIVVHGFTGAMTDVRLDVSANPREVTAVGEAKLAGGTVALRGYAPIAGTSIGFVDGQIIARGIHLAPSEGVAASLDADLRATLDPQATGGAQASLPHVSGDVLITSLEYTRPINLTTDLSALGGRAKRTVVETYDPTLDSVTFDVRVRAATPFKIKNNLVDLRLGIDSGTLTVAGTNQRFGIRGDLKSLAGGRFKFRSSDFEIRQGLIRFDDATRIAPNVDVVAVTEYRRYTDSSSSGGAASSFTSAGGTGVTRGAAIWRITLHAYGDADNLRIELTSDPSLSQEDVVLLLTVGMTRAEIDQLQASSLGASIALNYIGAATGADRAVTSAITIIDDFRFGSGTTRTGNVDPQLTIGKRLTDNLRASVTTGFSEDRQLRSNIALRLSNRLTVEGSYDNINDVQQSSLGNVGVDLRWRLEFE